MNFGPTNLFRPPTRGKANRRTGTSPVVGCSTALSHVAGPLQRRVLIVQISLLSSQCPGLASHGATVQGVPAMYVAQFRADDIYTSQITSAVWIDPKLLRLELVPGSTEPGGTWAHPPYVTQGELPYLVAAFNGGFCFQDARGGIYLEGKAGVPLVPGAASFVIYKDGRINCHLQRRSHQHR